MAIRRRTETVAADGEIRRKKRETQRWKGKEKMKLRAKNENGRKKKLLPWNGMAIHCSAAAAICGVSFQSSALLFPELQDMGKLCRSLLLAPVVNGGRNLYSFHSSFPRYFNSISTHIEALSEDSMSQQERRPWLNQKPSNDQSNSGKLRSAI
ncbi:hypothetical protein Gotri_017295 [Gossypium trilobum]|uniref:Uncharacterized protein n=1 Tax=Gossypium trilobum TaxID=34281 RepID=A0A7J9E632_9ROSI|nr:hypothetical protein [Gossypium trilobum]